MMASLSVATATARLAKAITAATGSNCPAEVRGKARHATAPAAANNPSAAIPNQYPRLTTQI